MQKALEQLDEVWTAARQAAVASRCAVEPTVPECETSHGIGIGIVIVPSLPTISAIAAKIDELSKNDAGQYWYPPTSLHITLHGIVWRENGVLPPESDLMRLKNALRPTMSGVGFPHLTLRGLNLFPGIGKQVGAIIVQGFPNDDLLLLRDRIRQCMVDVGYPDRRNYAFGRGSYLTCTIARLRKQPSNGLIARINESRMMEIAEFDVTELVLTSNSYFFTSENTTVRERFDIL